MKAFHAWAKAGYTFGMEIETEKSYRELKKRITKKTRGELDPACPEWMKNHKVYCAPAVWVGAIMREAHWLVTEARSLQKFYIEDGIGSWEVPIWIDYSELKEAEK